MVDSLVVGGTEEIQTQMSALPIIEQLNVFKDTLSSLISDSEGETVHHQHFQGNEEAFCNGVISRVSLATLSTLLRCPPNPAKSMSSGTAAECARILVLLEVPLYIPEASAETS